VRAARRAADLAGIGGGEIDHIPMVQRVSAKILIASAKAVPVQFEGFGTKNEE
jgi:hypothetical protein